MAETQLYHAITVYFVVTNLITVAFAGCVIWSASDETKKIIAAVKQSKEEAWQRSFR